jgi:hypothetical protein
MMVGGPLPLALRSPRLRHYGLFPLSRKSNPTIRLTTSGNGWLIREDYRFDIGVVVPRGPDWAVFAGGHGAFVRREQGLGPADAAWLLIAYLELTGARIRNDPVRHPIPGNADAFDEYWDSVVGARHRPLPEWALTPAGRWRWLSSAWGAVELNNETGNGYQSAERTMDNGSRIETCCGYSDPMPCSQQCLRPRAGPWRPSPH